MRNVNVRWQESQGIRGWNKYRFGLIGNSITNDGPFPSDLSSGCHAWCGTGIMNCSRPGNSFWATFLNETWGGPGAGGDDHPWLYDQACHGSANGNQIGATTSGGYTLLGNALNNLKPMWVTLEYGHNDGAVWNATRRSEWERLIGRALDSNIIPIVVTINPEQIGSSWDHDGRTPIYNDSLKTVAAQFRVPCLDWYGAAVDPDIGGCRIRTDGCTRDGVHPERSQSAGNFSDSVIFYPLAHAKGVLNPVCGLWTVMLLEMTYELREKVIYPADTLAAGNVFTYTLKDEISAAYIRTSNPTVNYGSSQDVHAEFSPTSETEKGMVRCNLAAFNSVDISKIASAVFEFHQTRGNVAIQAGLKKMLVSWDETSVTWNDRSLGTAWGTPGMGTSDYDNASLKYASLATSTSGAGWATDSWRSVDVTDWVKGWITSPSTNNGFAVVVTNNYTDLVFNSDDASDASLRPRLVIKATEDLGVNSVVKNPAAQTPEDFAISAFPTPFNPSTTISFAIPQSSNPKLLSVSVYTALGKMIRTFAETAYGPGSFSIRWDGKDEKGVQQATGMYCIVLSTEKIHKSCRVVLVK